MVKTAASFDAAPSLLLGAVEPTLRHASQLRATSSRLVGSMPATAPAAVQTDSRRVRAGDVFLAYRGVTSDGHAHIPLAVANGAALLVIEDPQSLPTGCTVPWIQCHSGRAAWAFLAAQAYDQPQSGLTLLGVTGTNGKTSTVWMIAELLKAAGIPCLSIGTLGASLDGVPLATTHTTPDPPQLYAVLAAARAQGVAVVAMEVSSHALSQDKLLPLRYEGCAFTSFSRDHLDFHGTMDDYFAAKVHLFTDLATPSARFALSAGLDRQVLPRGDAHECLVYGQHAEGASALVVTVGATGFDGSLLTLRWRGQEWTGTVPYFAEHALDNFAAAWALASKAAGRPLEPALWRRMAPVPGRLEQVRGRHAASVVVDYAHTPDALEKTLRVLRPFCTGRLSVVFGCGGDRDRGKRPLMGRIAETLADRVYLTSDNPRSEDPDAILREILVGLSQPAAAVVIADRAAAIHRAVADAVLGDMVVVAGKGHENHQILSEGTVPFDDRLVARAALDRVSI